jgi:hypothetical protein
MLLDASLLLYAVDRESRFHQPPRVWLEDVLSGPTRVGFPGPSLLAFLRIATHPRVLAPQRTGLRPGDSWPIG